MASQSGVGIPTSSAQQQPLAPTPPAHPTTFQELQDLTYPTCESLLQAARSIAASLSVSLTITHKSRNTPGLTPSQYRGCVVMTCSSKEECSFEWKGYGPVEGGWRMRPLQLPTLKKHTVTSWCLCNHPKMPLRNPVLPLLTSWEQLLETRFDYPDDFIHVATQLAHLHNTSVYLLALNLSDGKPKSNGREGATYIPRGFLTLSCVESEHGCPFEIKAREEDDGWYLRPWREKGKEVKGAVSTLSCKHTDEARASFHLKKIKKKSKAKKSEESQTPAPEPQAPQLLPHPNHEPYDPTFSSNLSTSQILGQIEGMQNYGHHYQPIASTSNAILPHSFDQFRNSLASYATSSGPLGSMSPQVHPQPHPQPHPQQSPKQNGKRSASSDSPAPKRSKPSRGPAFNALKATWKAFLLALDPQGRMEMLETPLAEGGIDPKAVLDWPMEDLKDFVETVAGDCPAGIRIHFRVLMGSDGERAWEEVMSTDIKDIPPSRPRHPLLPGPVSPAEDSGSADPPPMLFHLSLLIYGTIAPEGATSHIQSLQDTGKRQSFAWEIDKVKSPIHIGHRLPLLPTINSSLSTTSWDEDMQPIASTSSYYPGPPPIARRSSSDKDRNTGCSLCRHKKLKCDAVRPICGGCLRAASRGEYSDVPPCVYGDSGASTPEYPPALPPVLTSTEGGGGGGTTTKVWGNSKSARESKLNGLSERIDQLEKGVHAYTRPIYSGRSASQGSSLSSPSSSASSPSAGSIGGNLEPHFLPSTSRPKPGIPVMLPSPIMGKIPSNSTPLPSHLPQTSSLDAYKELYSSWQPGGTGSSSPEVGGGIPMANRIPVRRADNDRTPRPNIFVPEPPHESTYGPPNINFLRSGPLSPSDSPPFSTAPPSNNDFSQSSFPSYQPYNMYTSQPSSTNDYTGGAVEEPESLSPGYNPAPQDLQDQLAHQQGVHQRNLNEQARVANEEAMRHYSLAPSENQYHFSSPTDQQQHYSDDGSSLTSDLYNPQYYGDGASELTFGYDTMGYGLTGEGEVNGGIDGGYGTNDWLNRDEEAGSSKRKANGGGAGLLSSVAESEGNAKRPREGF